MSKTREIKTRMLSVASTKKITQAMKMVSTAKVGKLHNKLGTINDYLKHINSIVYELYLGLEDKIDTFKTPFISSLKKNNTYAEIDHEDTYKNNRILYVVISSDKGLCGAFNSKIFKQAKIYIDNTLADYKKNIIKTKKEDLSSIIDIMPIGKKGVLAIKKLLQNDVYLNFVNDINDYSDILNNLDHKSFNSFTNSIIQNFLDKKYSSIHFLYSKIDGASTKTVFTKLLPMNLDFQIPNNQNKNSTTSNKWGNIEKKQTTQSHFLFEDNPNNILNNLLPRIIKFKIYSMCVKSLAAEHFSRMVAMTKASDNADEILKELKLNYNRTRQAIITKELTEIIGGSEALSH